MRQFCSGSTAFYTFQQTQSIAKDENLVYIPDSGTL